MDAEELAVEQRGERQRVARVHHRVVQRVRVRVRPVRAACARTGAAARAARSACHRARRSCNCATK